MHKHILSIIVDNSKGVLAKTATLFYKLGFNVVSLTIGAVEDSRYSRITVTLEESVCRIDKLLTALNKRKFILQVEDLQEGTYLESELLLVKLAVEQEQRAEVIEYADIFNAIVVDSCDSTISLEISGDIDKINSFMRMLQSFEIMETVRTGTLAMQRGSQFLECDCN